MKRILYGIQGTGNGHISRALEIIPYLQKYGKVDLVVSGGHNELKIPYDVKYHFKGLGFFFGKNGGIDYWKTFLQLKVKNIKKTIEKFPIKDYDIIISDFEPITAWACKLNKIECIGLSNQCATLNLKAPAPKKTDWIGKMVLENYAPTSKNYGLHFKVFDKHIFTPIIPKDIRTLKTKKKNYYTVYLPAFEDNKIIKVLQNFDSISWEVFSKHCTKNYIKGNIKINKIDATEFKDSLASCSGVITHAGFGASAEAMYLSKKLLVIPMKGQLEQKYNAAMLKSMGVKVLKKFNIKNLEEIQKWISFGSPIKVNYPDNAELIVKTIMQNHLK